MIVCPLRPKNTGNLAQIVSFLGPDSGRLFHVFAVRVSSSSTLWKSLPKVVLPPHLFLPPSSNVGKHYCVLGSKGKGAGETITQGAMGGGGATQKFDIKLCVALQM